MSGWNCSWPKKAWSCSSTTRDTSVSWKVIRSMALVAVPHWRATVIRHPWHEVRRRVKGLADARLHAHAFPATARREDFETVAAFFRTQPFARLGAIISTKATRDDDISVLTTIAGVLKNRIIDLAKWMPFTEVNVIFEASDRADRMMEEAFGDFRLEEGGRPFPVECFFMPKAAGDPALEVADFVMHAVGRQARQRVDGKEGFVRDFAAVFHDQDPRRVSFMEVNIVARSG
jgi:hypothetical protein